MSSIDTALQDVTNAVQAATDEIAKLAQEIRSGGNPQATADALEALAGRLNDAVSTAETPQTPPSA